jgi:hypothetical protein
MEKYLRRRSGQIVLGYGTNNELWRTQKLVDLDFLVIMVGLAH